MWNQRPSFRFEIDNFSKKESHIKSQTFVSGGYEWFLYVYPKGDRHADNHLSLYLHVGNPILLPTGWKRSAKLYFVVLNQSDKVLHRTRIEQPSTLFCAKAPSWGFQKTLPLSKVHEKGVLENDKLIIEVYINVLEAVDGKVEDVLEKKETVDINGFQVFASQVRKKFTDHVVKTEYKNALSNACTKLSELAEEGFKLEWLKSKLHEISLTKKKKADDVDDGSRVQLVEERNKNLEVMESSSKMDCLRSKLEEISLERKKPYDAYGSCVQNLEERIKNLEVMEYGSEMDCLKSKLEEISLERNKPYDAYGSCVQNLEERIKNLEVMEYGSKMDCLRSKLEQISLESKKPYDAYKSCVQKLEERVKNLEVKELDLKLDALKLKLEMDSLERKESNDADRSRIEQLEVRINEFEFEYGFQLECLKSKCENDSLERKKAHDADGSRIQELADYLEDHVQNIELMVSDLKYELDKKKDKSSADGFMLVD